MKDIANGLLKGAGVKDLESWHAMGTDGKRDWHGNLARSWESGMNNEAPGRNQRSEIICSK